MSSVANVATVLVQFKLSVPLRDYPVAGQHFPSYEACFEFVEAHLQNATDSQQLQAHLIESLK